VLQHSRPISTNGSGGSLGDLEFVGGNFGAYVGNQTIHRPWLEVLGPVVLCLANPLGLGAGHERASRGIPHRAQSPWKMPRPLSTMVLAACSMRRIGRLIVPREPCFEEKEWFILGLWSG